MGLAPQGRTRSWAVVGFGRAIGFSPARNTVMESHVGDVAIICPRALDTRIVRWIGMPK